MALGPARIASRGRGAAMSLDTAAELALLLDRPGPADPAGALAHPAQHPGTGAGDPGRRGQTDAQIAGRLFISVSTVRSHLDRIRDKTGCRRRAELTRLALQEGLV